MRVTRKNNKILLLFLVSNSVLVYKKQAFYRLIHNFLSYININESIDSFIFIFGIKFCIKVNFYTEFLIMRKI
jgi:hypothetical protein